MANSFIHPAAIVEDGAKLGDGTRVWAFTHILPGAVIGSGCNICDGVFIENDVLIGDRVTIKCGVQIWDGVQLENDVFVGPNATFTNDPFPRSKSTSWQFERTIVHQGASIGANATILPGIEIGRHAMVGAGAVVTRSVPMNAIVVGNPARIKGYVSSLTRQPITQTDFSSAVGTMDTRVPGVKVFQLPKVVDLRGALTFAEYDQQLPFIPQRFFVIYGVPTKEVRGEHAHKTLHEFLVCLQGSVHVVVDNGKEQDEVILDHPELGLHLPPYIWTVQYNYSADAILLILASEKYAAEDYIRDYEEYLRLILSGKEQ